MDFFRFDVFGRYDNLLHAVTMRSVRYPCGLSLALHTGEDKREIIQNRKEVAKLFDRGVPMHFIVAKQTHSDHIVTIEEQASKGWKSQEDAVEDCDALITDRKNIILTILTADCVPVLLYDPKKEVVAAVHAGWKGTKAHIVAKCIEKMQKRYGCRAEDMVAGIGPSIGGCCYEVGKDVAAYFPDASEACRPRGEKFMLDLPEINRQQLLGAGLKAEQIEMSGICTSCESERFFSYRKTGGCSGRFMSMIGIFSEAK